MISSIDMPVGKIVIVDNGGVVEREQSEEVVIRTGANLGVAASWNLIFRATPHVPWWFFANFDLTFAPGDLYRLTEHMTTNKRPMVVMLGGYSAFAINREALAMVGTFDENFHPAYYEDNDFSWRLHLAGVPQENLPAGLQHFVSSTIHSDKWLLEENHRTFGVNAYHYHNKWGGAPGHEKYVTPFNEGGDIRDWRLDIDRLSGQTWRTKPPK
jgi:GT2 family glycosyltransferase